MIGGMTQAMPADATIVLLPGLACDAHLWAAQASTLRGAGWRVVVSDAHTRHATLEAMADSLFDAHGGRLTLIGSSMGAMVALHATLRQHSRVVGMALVGCSARADTPEMLALREAAILRFEAGELDAVLRENAPFALHPRHASDAALLEDYLAMVRRAGVPQLVRQNRAVMARPDMRSQLARIACPTLVVVGEADLLTTPEEAREIADAIPGARLETIEGAAHLPTLETPDAVSALLLSWLSVQPAGRPAPS
jgi:pimeloyl-ACP methyl ester carboxylesterase